jgi:hypothetical protein
LNDDRSFLDEGKETTMGLLKEASNPLGNPSTKNQRPPPRPPKDTIPPKNSDGPLGGRVLIGRDNGPHDNGSGLLGGVGSPKGRSVPTTRSWMQSSRNPWYPIPTTIASKATPTKRSLPYLIYIFRMDLHAHVNFFRKTI